MHWTEPERETIGGNRPHRILSSDLGRIYRKMYTRKWSLGDWICWLMFGE